MKMTTIKLPSARVEQLKAISKERGFTTVSALIASWVNREISEGVITDAIAGFTIKRDGESVMINAGSWKTEISTSLASAFAADIRKVSSTSRAITESFHKQPPDIVATFRDDIDAELALQARRQGQGVRLVDRLSGAEETVSVDIADDIAKLIEKAAH